MKEQAGDLVIEAKTACYRPQLWIVALWQVS